jgi:predicted TIM-barrel fold metal-dependent hydrolase
MVTATAEGTARGRAGGRIPIIDCDVHHAMRSPKDLYPYLPRQYQERIADLGLGLPSSAYGILGHGATRLDLWGPENIPPTANREQMRAELLDKYEIDYAILNCSALGGTSAHPDADYGMAIARAFNDYQIEHWCGFDPRFRCSLVVASSDIRAAAAEVRRLGGHPAVAQVLMTGGARFLFGNRYYDPLWEACAEVGIPAAVHPSAEGAGVNPAPTAAGYPSYYIEARQVWAQIAQAQVTSLVCEGTFDKFPGFRFVFIEHDTYWVPGLMWRLDADWKGLRTKYPWIKRLPSQYMRESIRFGSQPINEPETEADHETFLRWLHADELLVFASDYPHWDWDEPSATFTRLDERLRRRIFYQTASELYGARMPLVVEP